MPNVSVQSNIGELRMAAEELQTNIPKAAGSATERIAKTWKTQAQLTLMRNGNYVTGTGVNNFEIDSFGNNTTIVKAPAYLNFVDKGTVPHIPDMTNPRFEQAAASYGMDKQQLAASIARKGTQPHPWIQETTAKTSRKGGVILKNLMNKAIQTSLK